MTLTHEHIAVLERLAIDDIDIGINKLNTAERNKAYAELWHVYFIDVDGPNWYITDAGHDALEQEQQNG